MGFGQYCEGFLFEFEIRPAFEQNGEEEEDRERERERERVREILF